MKREELINVAKDLLKHLQENPADLKKFEEKPAAAPAPAPKPEPKIEIAAPAFSPYFLSKARVDEIGEMLAKKHIGFDKLKNQLAHKKNPPHDPAAVAAAIGRKKLGQKEMTRRSVAGHHKAEHNPDAKQDAELGEQVEHDVAEHINKDPKSHRGMIKTTKAELEKKGMGGKVSGPLDKTGMGGKTSHGTGMPHPPGTMGKTLQTGLMQPYGKKELNPGKGQNPPANGKLMAKEEKQALPGRDPNGQMAKEEKAAAYKEGQKKEKFGTPGKK